MDQSNENPPSESASTQSGPEAGESPKEGFSLLRATVQDWTSGGNEPSNPSENRNWDLEGEAEGMPTPQDAGAGSDQASHIHTAPPRRWGEDRAFDYEMIRHEEEIMALQSLRQQVRATEQTLIGAVDGIHDRLDQVAATEAHGHIEIKAGLATAKAIEDETRQWLEAAATALARDVEGGLARLLEIGGFVDQMSSYIGGLKDEVRQVAVEFQAMVREKFDSLDSKLTQAAEASVLARTNSESTVGNLQASIEEWKSGIAESALNTEVRLVRALEALEEGITHNQEEFHNSATALAQKIDATQRAYEEASGRQEQIIQQSVAEIAAGQQRQERLEEAIAANAASLQRIEELAAELAGNVTHGDPFDASELSSHAASEAKFEEVAAQLTESLGRQERLEATLSELVAAIEGWKTQGRESAVKSKQRLAASLEALEVRILQTHDAELAQQDLVRQELASLSEVVGRGQEGGAEEGDSIIMRGLEELDDNVLQTTEALAKLSKTFAVQFEVLEHRVTDQVSDRLSELERAIGERDRALLRLMLGPQDDALAPRTRYDAETGRKQRVPSRRP